MQSLGSNLVDLCYATHKNKLLINKPIFKIAKILKISTPQLTLVFRLQYPNLNWDKNKSIREIVLPTERDDCQSETKAEIAPEMLEEGFNESCPPKKKRKLSEPQRSTTFENDDSKLKTKKKRKHAEIESCETPKGREIETQMRELASRIYIVLSKGLNFPVVDSQPPISQLPLLTMDDLLRKLNIPKENAAFIRLSKLQPKWIALQLCLSTLPLTDFERLKAIEILLQQDVRLLRQVDGLGNTPLHCAVVTSRDEIVRLLARHLNPTDCNAQNSNGLTPLHLALKNRKLENLFLLEICNFLQPNIDGITPLHIVAKYGCPDPIAEKYYGEVLKHIPKDFDFNTHVDCYNQTPMHFAAININMAFIPLLLRAGSRTTCQDIRGDTPLMKAIEYGALKDDLDHIKYGACIDSLVDKESLFLRNNIDRNIFHYAAIYLKIPRIFDQLCQKAIEFGGSEYLLNMLIEPDKAGITPAMYARAHGSCTWKIIEGILPKEIGEIQPSKEKLTCGTCLRIFKEPVILPSGNILCQCCVENAASKALPVDEAIKKIIQVHDLNPPTEANNSLTYTECLLNNLEYLGRQIGQTGLRLDKSGAVVLDVGTSNMQILIRNAPDPDEPYKSRLVLSVQTLVPGDKKFFSFEKIKRVLELCHLDSDLVKGGICISRQGALVFLIALSHQDLMDTSKLNETTHLIVSIARRMRSYFEQPAPQPQKMDQQPTAIRSQEDRNLRTNESSATRSHEVDHSMRISVRSRSACENSPQQIPRSGGATYYILNNTLHLLVPINIDLNAPQLLNSYLNQLDMVNWSFPIIKDGQLFRKLTVYVHDGVIDQQQLRNYVTALRNIKKN